jgi:hypothetical protein
MKILIGTQFLDKRSGTEVFTSILVRELRTQGHEVDLYSPILGGVSSELQREGFNVYETIEPRANYSYDVLHVHHRTIAPVMRIYFPFLPMIYVSHGVLPFLEHAPDEVLNINKYVAVSREVQQSLINSDNVQKEKIIIIPNGVDTNIFKDFQPIHKKIETILILSNHFLKEDEILLEKYCQENNIQLIKVGGIKNSVSDVQNWICKADLVVTLGRGVIESLACGRAVFVWDRHGADGYLDKKNFYVSQECNFSGRKSKIKPDKKFLESELSKYDPTEVRELQSMVKSERSITFVAKKFVKLYESVLNTERTRQQSTSFPLSAVSEEMQYLMKLQGTMTKQKRKLEEDNILLLQKKSAIQKERDKLKKQLDESLKIYKHPIIRIYFALKNFLKRK